MCTDHGDWVSGLPFLAYRKSYDGGAVAGEKVFSSWRDGLRPAFLLEDLLEAGRFEELDRGGDSVEC